MTIRSKSPKNKLELTAERLRDVVRYNPETGEFMWKGGKPGRKKDGLINRNRADNRIANLRPATQSQNSQNMSINPRNKSGAPGVFWHKKRRVWYAFITINRKQKWIGQFHDRAAAIDARRAAELEHFGEFAPQHDE